MKLPNGDRAVVPMEKLIGYCLNPSHSAGKHKARVFASALGITAETADSLRSLIRIAAIEGEVVQEDETAFGQVFKVDWPVPQKEQVVLRTIWEITSERPHPRLVSAFIR